jgi:uncharacterized protein
MEQNSVSKIKLILEIRGKAKLNCELKRHLSPRTVGIISRSLPLEGNGHVLSDKISYFETTIESGIERPRKDFKKGDIAFLPANGSICFFSEDTLSTKTMTPIGKIISDPKIINEIKPGDVFMFYADIG